MESGQSLQRRMRSVKNIGQITKAMELVAATKMRRAQELALASRPYAYTALELLGLLSNVKDAHGGKIPTPELLQPRDIEKTAFMIVTSDKGLAGSFNGSVIRAFEKYVRENAIDLSDPKYSFIAIGQKARIYLERKGLKVEDAFTRVGDFTTTQEVDPVSDLLIAEYLNHNFDQVISFSTIFITALRQEVMVRELLPISFESVKQSVEELVPQAGRYSHYLDVTAFEGDREKEYIIEPSAKEVMDELAPELLKIRIYHMILEANASEHSARRVAMKNASDNASDLSQSLSVVYNKQRQAAITSQIIEVTSGAQAMQ